MVRNLIDEREFRAIERPLFDFSSGWGEQILVLAIALPLTAVIMIAQWKAYKSRLMKDPALVQRAKIEDQIRTNLPKFWIPRVIIGIIVGIVMIAFGIQYFWNTPGITPSSDLTDGFIVVMGGVIVGTLSAASRFLPIAKEIDRRRREAYDENN